MNKPEWLEILERGEDYKTEFKEQAVHHDGLAAEIVGFANSDGGKLLMGIRDDRTAIGLVDADTEIQRIDNVCANNCEPPILC